MEKKSDIEYLIAKFAFGITKDTYSRINWANVDRQYENMYIMKEQDDIQKWKKNPKL